MHDHGVLHRDLKPANLLVNKVCDLKISDFGLARVAPDSIEDEPTELMTEHVVTRWYRPPELMLSPNGSYDGSVDMWSAGCILAELLGRKPLFPGKNFMNQLGLIFEVIGNPKTSSVAHIQNDQAIRFLRSLPKSKHADFSEMYKEASPGAIDLLRHLLVFEPSGRYTAAEALKHNWFTDVNYPWEIPEVDVGCIDVTFETQKLSKTELHRIVNDEIVTFCREKKFTSQIRRESALSNRGRLKDRPSRPASADVLRPRTKRSTSNSSRNSDTGRSRTPNGRRDVGHLDKVIAQAVVESRTYSKATKEAIKQTMLSRKPPVSLGREQEKKGEGQGNSKLVTSTLPPHSSIISNNSDAQNISTPPVECNSNNSDKENGLTAVRTCGVNENKILHQPPTIGADYASEHKVENIANVDSDDDIMSPPQTVIVKQRNSESKYEEEDQSRKLSGFKLKSNEQTNAVATKAATSYMTGNQNPADDESTILPIGNRVLSHSHKEQRPNWETYASSQESPTAVINEVLQKWREERNSAAKLRNISSAGVHRKPVYGSEYKDNKDTLPTNYQMGVVPRSIRPFSAVAHHSRSSSLNNKDLAREIYSRPIVALRNNNNENVVRPAIVRSKSATRSRPTRDGGGVEYEEKVRKLTVPQSPNFSTMSWQRGLKKNVNDNNKDGVSHNVADYLLRYKQRRGTRN